MTEFDNINEETTKNLAPELFSLGKHNPFEVPEGYFETLPQFIQDKCVESTHKKSLWESIYIYGLRPQSLLAAACITLLVMFGLQNYKNNIVKSKEIATINAYLNELDENVLIEGLAKKGPETGLDREAATEYLLDQNIDPSQITN